LECHRRYRHQVLILQFNTVRDWGGGDSSPFLFLNTLVFLERGYHAYD